MELDFSLFFTNTSVEERLAESAAKIAFYNFEWRFITFVFLNTTLLCREEVFAKFYNKSMIVSQSEYDTLSAQSAKQHVLFVTDNKNIELILHWMQERVFDNTGKHVIICLSENKEDCSESQAMRIFWNYKVTNVVFIRRVFNETGIVGYTYYPLEDNLCDISPPVRLYNLDTCIDVTSKDNCKMFPRKLTNLHGCTLIVSTFEHPPYVYLYKNESMSGIVGDMTWLLGERLNATFKIMTPYKSNGWGVRQPDGSWVGSLGDVYHDLANFSSCFTALTHNRFESFDMSTSYNFVHFVWITRPTQFESSSLKLLRPFRMDTHIAVATTYTLVIGLALLTKTKFWTEFSTKININRSQSSVVFYSWMLFLGLPTNVLPKKRTLLVIVYIWIWYTFLIRTIYQAALINSLKHNVYLPNYDTVEAANDAGFRFGGGVAIKEYYTDSPTIYNKWIVLDANMIDITTEKITEGYKFVEANNFESVKLFRQKFKNRKLHILPHFIVVSPTVVYFKKFSPLVEPVNRVLERLTEAGFTNKFYNDYTNLPTSEDPKTNEPITLEHFKGCYIILFTGWIVSFVLFICEIIFGHWMKIN
ncbi:uncharacterized protein LOC113231859 [Hyposmocoma kahamanoa]|uniref:uncharacterized protein LOC113231859 n=1 Tax=Hyposmocoma kahamanoa TaxID=1477025 RepID=UPI000E6D694B|nr:uncharacterized protein LOC113231859 [Hyposmocoma kahamanoa]